MRRPALERPVTLSRGRKPRAAIYQQLQQGVEELRTRFGGLPSPLEAEDIWDDIWYREAHHSTALEGNSLVLKEVELLLREGRAVGDKQLREYLEVQGYADAARWVYGRAVEPEGWESGALLSVTEVRYVHQLAMAPVWDVAPHPDATTQEGPGGFRRHDIRSFPGGMRPPSWTDGPALMDDWVQSVLRITLDESPLLEAIAQRHAAFERIHPFIDGNGRAGRLLTNLVLIRLGYPPAVIRKGERQRYLGVLRKADGGDPGPLGEFLARNVLDTLHRFVVPAVAGPSRLVPLVALTDGDMSVEALRKAAERGRLKSYRNDKGLWLSSRNWVEAYKQSRSPRGRRVMQPH